MQDEQTFTPESNQATEPVLSRESTSGNLIQIRKCYIMFSLGLNILLLAGLVVLYILFFTSKKHEVTSVPLNIHKSGDKGMTVVFVNLDTLNTRYEYVKALKTDLEGTGRKLQAEIQSEQSAFEKEAAEFQKQVQANTIPEARAKIIYEALMQKQQALAEKKDKFTQQVSEKELSMNLQLLDTVTSFLKRYNRRYHFDYILGYKTAGEILLANDTLDITGNVLDEMNRAYSERKK